MNEFKHIKSISQLHRLLGLSSPQHPSITIVNSRDINIPEEVYGQKHILGFYSISLKFHNGELYYGRNYYDFEEGTLLFISPGQVITPTKPTNTDSEMDNGWSIFFHPDLILKSDLGNKMNRYSFFDYNINESLHLSEEEKKTISDCLEKIKKEYTQNIDKHSQELIISNLELFLNYCNRFHDRQFYTRSNHNQDYVTKMETLLSNYFSSNKVVVQGLPTVKYCADKMNLSSNYLSDLLKKETGKSTKQHIDSYILSKAKNLLLTSNQTISEVAYDLGFEYPQSFSNFFKKKTGATPNNFRQMN